MTETNDLDYERRFGGLERLYGPDSLAVLRSAHVMVAGIGGVGSWCAEALARSGVGALTLIDMDHVAESNINRQAHALDSTLGQAKVQAMADRLRDINPSCRVDVVDDFVDPGNIDALLAANPAVLIDCTDQAQAKIAMVLACRQRKIPLVLCGGAGGKTDPLSLRAGDISMATNDALLAKLRNTLRRLHGYPKAADKAGKALKRIPRMHVRSLWFDQAAILPKAWTDTTALQGLSCAGYGSVVTITAVMGMAAANQATHRLLYEKFPA
jgi:tRNA A37 threonylcarbamoyladenosine dehydratase